MVDLQNGKKTITIDELESGMILAEKIISEGTVLVNRGVVVTESIIEKLKEKFIFYPIEIFSDEDGKIDFIAESRECTVEEIEQIFKELTFDIEKIFKNIDSLSNLEAIEEVQKFAYIIQNKLNSERTIVKNIVLYGSGKDIVYRHSVNVTALSALLGKWLGFNDEQMSQLICSAILHDFGKVKIQDIAIDKTYESDSYEENKLRFHPIMAYNIIKEIPDINISITQGILLHHERINGTGYPYGFKGDKIHPFARIIAIADTFDELNSNRENSPSKGPFEVLDIIQRESYGRLDYEYCRIFLEHVINFYISEKVILSNKKVVQIIQIDFNDISKPLLLDETGFIDLKKEKNIFVKKMVV